MASQSNVLLVAGIGAIALLALSSQASASEKKPAGPAGPSTGNLPATCGSLATQAAAALAQGNAALANQLASQAAAAGCMQGMPGPVGPQAPANCQALLAQGMQAAQAGNFAAASALAQQYAAAGCPPVGVGPSGPVVSPTPVPTPGVDQGFCSQQASKAQQAIALANMRFASGDLAGAQVAANAAQQAIRDAQAAGCQPGALPAVPNFGQPSLPSPAAPPPGPFPSSGNKPSATAACQQAANVFDRAKASAQQASLVGSKADFDKALKNAQAALASAAALGCPIVGAVLPTFGVPSVPSVPSPNVPPPGPFPPSGSTPFTQPGSGELGKPVIFTLRFGDIPVRLANYYTGDAQRFRELGDANDNLGPLETKNGVTNYRNWRPGLTITIPASWDPGLKPLPPKAR